MALQLQSTADFNALAEYMRHAFPGRDGKDELDSFAKDSLNISIYEEFADGGTFALIVKFLERAEKSGDMDKVLPKLLVLRPGDAQLRALVGRVLPAALELVTEAAHNEARVKLTEEGLHELDAQAGNPVIAQLVSAARLDLEKIPKQLKLLAAYKELHDVLHSIQVPTYARIRTVMPDYPAAPLAAIELTTHADTLMSRATDAADVVANFPDPSLAGTEVAWTKSLTAAAEKFSGAIGNGDKAGASQALMAIKVILRAQPPRLDALLVRLAREIPIEKLVAVLRAVGEQLEDEPERKSLEDAAAALDSLTCDVRTRAQEHEAWQVVESQFWLTEDAISRTPPDLDELNGLWPALTEQLDAIANMSPGPWAKELSARALAFTTICPMPAEPPVNPDARGAMESYLSRGRLQFYLVDKALKERCLYVAKLSEPLNTLVDNG